MNEAELLFTQFLNCHRQDLYLERDKILDKKDCEFVCAVLKKRVLGEPLQYILGKTEFMGLEFKVCPEVFIPRPETEILVETAIKVTRSQGHKVTSILDIGTGSGCIAISLAKLLPEAEVTATDISSGALGVAQENANLNKTKVNFIKADLLDIYHLRPMTYDLIVSNPPYIPTSEIKLLQPELQYEPLVALDGGMDGLDFYRAIIKNAPKNLADNGLLILEMGLGQSHAIKGIASDTRELSLVEVIQDYNNIERVVIFKKSGSRHG